MSDQPNMVQIEYESGYARLGMGDRYTIRMLKHEFCALIGDDWSLYPALAYRRVTDGSIFHHSISEYDEIRSAVANNLPFDLPEKYQEDAGTGTEINIR
jgi:hypothetical protein